MASRATATRAEIQAVLSVLSKTPKQIAGIARGRSDRQLHRNPAPDAWSAQEIVGNVSPRGWIRKTDYLQDNFRDSLRAFSQERRILVKTLSALDADDWSRGATLTATTLGRKATVLSYATRIAEHEVRHLDQLRRTVRT